MRRDYLGVALVATVIRLLYFALGVRFDIDPVWWYWQFLDPVELQSRLLESLWFLHAQPPLLNAVTGVVFKLFGDAAPFFLQLIMVGMGVAFNVVFFHLALAASQNRKAAMITTLLVALNPAYVLYENNFFYTHPVIFLLALSLLCLERMMAGNRNLGLLGYGLCLGGLVMLRSMYHPLWLVVNLALPFAFLKFEVKRLAIALAILLAVLAWPMKNLLLFDSFSTSTWSGMNLYNTVYNQSFSEEEMRQFYAGGRLPPTRPSGATSEIGDRRPFGNPNVYARFFQYEPTGIAVLDKPFKHNNRVNYNYGMYIQVGATYMQDYLRVVQENPLILAKVFLSSLKYYFRPALDYDVLRLTPIGRANQENVAVLDALFRKAFYLQVFRPSLQGPPDPVQLNVSLSVFAGTLLILFMLPLYAWREKDAPYRAMATFIWMNIAYVMVIGNLFENYENMRFRFETEMLWLLGLLLLGRIYFSHRQKAEPSSESA